jgi:hypothetical protein
LKRVRIWWGYMVSNEILKMVAMRRYAKARTRSLDRKLVPDFI